MPTSFTDFHSRFRAQSDIVAILVTIAVGYLSAVYNYLQLAVCDHADHRVTNGGLVRQDQLLGSFPCPGEVVRGAVWFRQHPSQRQWIMEHGLLACAKIGLRYHPMFLSPFLILSFNYIAHLLKPDTWHKQYRMTVLVLYRLFAATYLSSFLSMQLSTCLDKDALVQELPNHMAFNSSWRGVLHGVPLLVSIPLFFLETALCFIGTIKAVQYYQMSVELLPLMEGAAMALSITLCWTLLEHAVVRSLYRDYVQRSQRQTSSLRTPAPLPNLASDSPHHQGMLDRHRQHQPERERAPDSGAIGELGGEERHGANGDQIMGAAAEQVQAELDSTLLSGLDRIGMTWMLLTQLALVVVWLIVLHLADNQDQVLQLLLFS